MQNSCINVHCVGRADFRLARAEQGGHQLFEESKSVQRLYTPLNKTLIQVGKKLLSSHLSGFSTASGLRDQKRESSTSHSENDGQNKCERRMGTDLSQGRRHIEFNMDENEAMRDRLAVFTIVYAA